MDQMKHSSNTMTNTFYDIDTFLTKENTNNSDLTKNLK